jgi:hypothetical protein
MNTLSVDYHERGTDYQGGAEPQFRDRSLRDGRKRKRQTHQIEIRSFILTGRTLFDVNIGWALHSALLCGP